MPVSKIVLIGFMGSGKSSVGPLLAQQLGLPLVEVDRLVIERSELKSIPEIFNVFGENGFRDMEAAVARSLRDTSSAVISTGGGIIGRTENMENLKHNRGIIVFLKTDFAEVVRRVKDLEDRPLFRDHKRAQDLFVQRLPIYTRYADITVETNGKDASIVCAEILTHLQALA